MRDDVLLVRMRELARLLGMSERSIQIKRRHGTFPIPEFPHGLDRFPRWDRAEVMAWIQRQKENRYEERGPYFGSAPRRRAS